VLVVRAGRGRLSAADARAMAERGQRVEVVDLPEAEHYLHLDSPDEWRAAVSRFLMPSTPGEDQAVVAWRRRSSRTNS
jgi:pimeloyl-ACP methyl ester carboxylesterase